MSACNDRAQQEHGVAPELTDGGSEKHLTIGRVDVHEEVGRVICGQRDLDTPVSRARFSFPAQRAKPRGTIFHDDAFASGEPMLRRRFLQMDSG